MPIVRPVIAPRRGIITAVDTRAVGLVVMGLGGGRRKPTDRVDPAVGLTAVRGPGFRTGPNRPVALVHARTEAAAVAAEATLLAAITLGDTAPPPTPIVRARRAG